MQETVLSFEAMAIPDPPVGAANPELRGLVLHIEDDPTSAELVAAALGSHPGLRVLRAGTGAEGVALARSERPQVVLLDMHLPDCSGIEVVRTLSEDIASGRFRVILLTGDPLNIDVFKAMSLGAIQYLPKPVKIASLEAALGRALEPAGRRMARGAGERR